MHVCVCVCVWVHLYVRAAPRETGLPTLAGESEAVTTSYGVCARHGKVPARALYRETEIKVPSSKVLSKTCTCMCPYVYSLAVQ